MTQGERVNEVRKKSQLTMDQFGERLGVTKTAISYVVNGKRNLTEQMLKSICREFSVDEEWLRTGDGDMPQKLSEEEEVAALVSDLLEDGRDNPFFGIILEIVQTYNELSPASQKVLQEASKKLVENLSKKKEYILKSTKKKIKYKEYIFYFYLENQDIHSTAYEVVILDNNGNIKK